MTRRPRRQAPARKWRHRSQTPSRFAQRRERATLRNRPERTATYERRLKASPPDRSPKRDVCGRDRRPPAHRRRHRCAATAPPLRPPKRSRRFRPPRPTPPAGNKPVRADFVHRARRRRAGGSDDTERLATGATVGVDRFAELADIEPPTIVDTPTAELDADRPGGPGA